MDVDGRVSLEVQGGVEGKVDRLTTGRTFTTNDDGCVRSKDPSKTHILHRPYSESPNY